jgi:hypothetical protein
MRWLDAAAPRQRPKGKPHVPAKEKVDERPKAQPPDGQGTDGEEKKRLESIVHGSRPATQGKGDKA